MLFIAKTDGITNFLFDQVQIDLISISKMDIGIGFDEVNLQTIEVINTIPVSYVQSETGPTPNRLNALINDVGFTSPPNIIIFGVDNSFILSDGTPIGGNGIAIPVGESGNPFTNHIATFYDMTLCGGAGIWVDKEGGGHTQLTTDVMLYHELSHCFHFVTGTTAAGAQEEVNAEIDENDMRDVRGLSHRDVNSHNGGCGGGEVTCCIVASLATGSPYSDEVGQLRHFREHVLRRSEVGDDFFKHFFYHYYGFSPEICRLIGHQPNLSPLIRKYFVVPLLAGFELLIHYTNHKGQGLVDVLHQQAARDDLSDIYRQEFLTELENYLKFVKNHNQTGVYTTIMAQGNNDSSGVTELFRYINGKNTDDEFINWTLVDVVEIWVTSAFLIVMNKTDEEVNNNVYELISRWIAGFPITSIWGEFSRIQTENELNNLEQFLFDSNSKEIFAQKLVKNYPNYATTIHHWAQSQN
jgi:hypothetical protein